MDSLQGHPHSTWEALASKEVSTQHLGCCLLRSTDLLGTPTLAISLKYLLAQLGAKAGTLQPSHWLGPGEDFPFGQALHPHSPLGPPQRDLLLQRLQETLALRAGKQRAGTTIYPFLHTVFWSGWVRVLPLLPPDFMSKAWRAWVLQGQGDTWVAPCGSLTSH